MAALPRLRQQLGDRSFSTWIEPIRCTKEESGFRLEVGSRFVQEWVTRHYLASIRDHLAGVSGAMPTVRLVVTPHLAPTARTPELPPPPPRLTPPVRRPKLNRLVPEYTFDNFVVGASNEVAYRAARSLGDVSGPQFNPLFLCGGVGLGKTHLVNAVAHELLRRPARRRTACLPAEAFMNTLISALRQDQMNAFRDRFRQVDVLILDDVHFLAGKERTQEEFFHTFNALHANGKQVVLTSDKPPHAIADLEQRLRSRFEGGLIADIHPPTPEMRVAILIKKAARQGTELPETVARTIAQRSGATVRELEGALTRVLAASTLRNATLDPEFAERVLLPLSPPPVIVAVEAIQEAVSRHFHLSVADLKSYSRERNVTYARQVAMYLSRTLADSSFPTIAEKFGGRDHSTVIHAVRALEQKLDEDPSTGSLLTALEHELRSPSGA